ncbi:MAG TPA: penicillin-binding protein 2 [Geminicoccus sp.]|jgi:penicillin-binding protein 2|uniref:penicillin-binding protein 2 n=1 Tax=Geminicoccus sp. TaxID=2024832 RepID=UPI002E3408E8|nr:penicillin-binding protein 2 [Geminicoccus sp.]HEX2527259.1 penicillin-binding protein 2 [Geminicoccus sp.]
MQQEAERIRWFRRRSVLLGAGTFGVFGGLVGRLWYLQMEQGERYQLLSEENRVNQRLILPPRGRVLDRAGRPLAENIPTYRVRIIRELTKDVPGTLERLAAVIPVTPERIAEVIRQVQARPRFVPVSVRDDLDWEEVSLIAVRAPELPGIILDSGMVRRYPEGPAAAHVLGYVGPVDEPELKSDADPLLQLPDFRIGKQGVERSYDPVLRGKAGLSRVEVNAVGREIRELDRDEGQPGQDLELSLDLELQRFCMNRLAAETSAAAAVVDVRTGGVLALASVPSFDPTLFQNGISTRNWGALRDDKLAPMVNKAFKGEYPPGSTFKMMIALAGLETGVIKPDTRIRCSGSTWLGRIEFHCWKKGGHGAVDLQRSLEVSCDVYHYEVARRLGIDRLAEYARRFGLGERTAIDLPGERPGVMPTVAWKKAKLKQPWHKGETLISGIGQGYVLATPLQLAIMTARLSNGGYKVSPWLVRGGPRHMACCGAMAEPVGVAKEHLDLVLGGMHRVVNSPAGTARAAALLTPGVQMGGKTGTSQVRRISKADRLSGAYKRKDIPWEQRDHALFVGYAPFTEPRYAVAVVVEHGGGGSAVAAPIARDILDRVLQLDGQPVQAPDGKSA